MLNFFLIIYSILKYSKFPPNYTSDCACTCNTILKSLGSKRDHKERKFSLVFQTCRENTYPYTVL